MVQFNTFLVVKLVISNNCELTSRPISAVIDVGKTEVSVARSLASLDYCLVAPNVQLAQWQVKAGVTRCRLSHSQLDLTLL